MCVCVCGMCDVRSLAGAWSSVRDFAVDTHMHTHPKALGEEREVVKPLIAPLTSLYDCLSVERGVCRWRGGQDLI